jgi:hypothetical protein
MTPALVGSGIDHIRIARIERDIGDAGIDTDLEYGFPCSAAVGCLEQSAISATRPERTFGSHEYHVRVARIDKNPADML